MECPKLRDQNAAIPFAAGHTRENISVLHPWYVGHFDHDALRHGKLVVREPLDMAMLETELDRVARAREGALWYIQQDRFFIAHGYVCCWDFVKSREAADFMVDLATRTGSEIAFPEVGVLNQPAEFLEFFMQLSAMRASRRARARESRAASAKPAAPDEQRMDQPER